MKIIKIKELSQMISCSKSNIYSKVQRNEFPKQFKIGSGNCRASGWLLSDIEGWIMSQAESGKDIKKESSENLPTTRMKRRIPHRK